MTEEKQALTLVTAIRDGLRVQSNAVKNERSARARRAGRRAARHAGALDALLAALTAMARDLARTRQSAELIYASSKANAEEVQRLARDLAEARQRYQDVLTHRGEVIADLEASEKRSDAAVRAARAETLRELRAEIAEAKTGLYGEVSGIRALEIIDSKLAAREGQ